MNANRRRLSKPTILTLTAAILLLGAPVFAEADLVITSMQVVGTPKVGTCNKINMTVKNEGDAFTGNATLDITLVTFPSGTPFQNRVTKDLFISPMQPGAQTSFPINNVEFKVAGSATVQAVVDSTDETPESNENNNSSTLTTTVSGTCYAPPPPPPPGNQNCDVEAVFTNPSGTTVPGGGTYTYQVAFTNKGTSNCEAFKVKLLRYNSTSCGGYGSQVGGSRAWQSIPILRPGNTTVASFPEKGVPQKGKACLKLGYSPNNYNDANNANHRPKKVVTYQ